MSAFSLLIQDDEPSEMTVTSSYCSFSRNFSRMRIHISAMRALGTVLLERSVSLSGQRIRRPGFRKTRILCALTP